MRVIDQALIGRHDRRTSPRIHVTDLTRRNEDLRPWIYLRLYSRLRPEHTLAHVGEISARIYACRVVYSRKPRERFPWLPESYSGRSRSGVVYSYGFALSILRQI